MSAGPVADQPVRPRTPPGVGTPLRSDRLLKKAANDNWRRTLWGARCDE